MARTAPSGFGSTSKAGAVYAAPFSHRASLGRRTGRRRRHHRRSGGRGNSYYLTVKAVHRMGDETHELAAGTLEMGKY